ncbi:YibE/F family protein [Patescibacteria group bacterium]|nr:YibE/F family protein [Patescibacteria group bacterium]
MRKILSLLFLATALLLPNTGFAQDALPLADEVSSAPVSYERGRVIDIVSTEREELMGYVSTTQTVLVEIVTGADDGAVKTIEYVINGPGFEAQELKRGNVVILSTYGAAPETFYYIVDTYRLPSVMWLFFAFFALAVVLGGRRGFGAIVGLSLSILVLLFYVAPRIFAGDSPVFVSVIAATCIMTVSLLFAHGFSKRSFVSLASTLLSLLLAFALAALAVFLTGVSGTGTEEAMYLKLSVLPDLNLQGLLLGAIVIGALGVLDDVTTAQVAAVEEIHRANPKLSMGELYRRGLSVGREHIAALVNTLALAYVGASMPLFLLFSTPDSPPAWVIANGENIVEEILRALVGGMSLMLAVPIATLLAAFLFGRGVVEAGEERASHGHSH